LTGPRPGGARTPAVWVVAPVGIAFSIWLMVALPWVTWERFIVWMALGFIVYFLYGIRHSMLADKRDGV